MGFMGFGTLSHLAGAAIAAYGGSRLSNSGWIVIGPSELEFTIPEFILAQSF
jgi:hypothetical protein